MGKLEAAMRVIADDRSSRRRLFLGGVWVGLLTGCVVAFFRAALTLTEEMHPHLIAFLRDGGWPVLCGWALLLVLSAVFLSRLLAWEPMCSGSGIPQVKGILLGEMKMRWLRVLLAKVFGGILAIGLGMSLGREGPSVQIGACVGQGVSELRHKPRTVERLYLTAGAGAGLAAAFNAPLAGVIFCLEELAKSFSPLVLMATIAATLSATVVTRIAFGGAPVFHFPAFPVLPLADLWLMGLLGVLIGVLGILFNRGLFLALDLYGRFPLPGFFRPLLPLVVGTGLMFVAPEVLGGGSLLVDTLVEQPFLWPTLLLLLALKYFYTMLSFGSGVPGGIFLPMLVLGAIGGALFARLVEVLQLAPPEYAVNFIVFGMAGYFAAVVRSPVTGSILVMEMTGSFEHLLALIFVSLAAYLTADFLKGQPVYDALLLRSLRRERQIAQRLSAHRAVAEFVVGPGSALDGALVRDIVWPKDSLLVNVCRGEMERIPHGDLRLLAGDFIYVFVEDREIAALQSLTEPKKEDA
ncbi:MAG: ClC family H(+)/Cl(-) exchange transporter [Schwartzia sp. (in: firmicutes)]